MPFAQDAPLQLYLFYNEIRLHHPRLLVQQISRIRISAIVAQHSFRFQNQYGVKLENADLDRVLVATLWSTQQHHIQKENLFGH